MTYSSFFKLLPMVIFFALGTLTPLADAPQAGTNATGGESSRSSGQAVASTPDEAQEIDLIGTKLNHQIDGIGNEIAAFMDEKITSYLGNWVNSTAPFGISWLTFIACGSLVVLVLIIERLLRALNRRLMRRMSGEEKPFNLLELILAALARPLSLLLWTYGLFAAFSPFFQYFRQPDGTNVVQGLAHQATHIAGSVVPFWAIFGFIGLLDDALESRAKRSGSATDRILSTLMSSWRRPLKTLFLIVWVRLVVSIAGGPKLWIALVNHGFAMALIGTMAWLIIRTTDILEDLVLSRYRIDVADNLEARKIHTQIRFLKRVIVTVVLVIAAASMLMVFPKVRQFGASILASAGVVGIVAGLAVQRSIANLLVGIQVAITQPIRVDDVVIVENEWGQIEEITSTYVVVRIWDLRRLILPITYFTEKPFENWTRTSADLIGTVFIYADYSIPVDAVRQELHRILQESDLWDGKAWALQVTDAREHTIELRAMVSAANASAAWNLRCQVREELILFIQKNYPESLPKFRTELTRNGSEEKPAFLLPEKAGAKS